MARTFAYEFSISAAPEEAQARLQRAITERLRRPKGGGAGSNIHREMRLSKRTSTSLIYKPKLVVPMPVSTIVWAGRRLGGQHVDVTFVPEEHGTHVAVSGKVGGGAEVVADPEFWVEVVAAG